MANPDPSSYYAVLGVSTDADQEAIARAFRAAALREHPDKSPEGEREEANRRFQAINQAFSVLGDPGKRLEYDNETRLEEGAETARGDSRQSAPVGGRSSIRIERDRSNDWSSVESVALVSRMYEGALAGLAVTTFGVPTVGLYLTAQALGWIGLAGCAGIAGWGAGIYLLQPHVGLKMRHVGLACAGHLTGLAFGAVLIPGGALFTVGAAGTWAAITLAKKGGNAVGLIVDKCLEGPSAPQPDLLCSESDSESAGNGWFYRCCNCEVWVCSACAFGCHNGHLLEKPSEGQRVCGCKWTGCKRRASVAQHPLLIAGPDSEGDSEWMELVVDDPTVPKEIEDGFLLIE